MAKNRIEKKGKSKKKKCECARIGIVGTVSGRENGAHNMWCITMTMGKSQIDTKHIVVAYNSPHIQPI